MYALYMRVCVCTCACMCVRERGGRGETHGEAVIDVLGAGLSHAGVGQVDLVKDDGLQRNTRRLRTVARRRFFTARHSEDKPTRHHMCFDMTGVMSASLTLAV